MVVSFGGTFLPSIYQVLNGSEHLRYNKARTFGSYIGPEESVLRPVDFFDSNGRLFAIVQDD